MPVFIRFFKFVAGLFYKFITNLIFFGLLITLLSIGYMWYSNPHLPLRVILLAMAIEIGGPVECWMRAYYYGHVPANGVYNFLDHCAQCQPGNFF